MTQDINNPYATTSDEKLQSIREALEGAIVMTRKTHITIGHLCNSLQLVIDEQARRGTQ